MHTTGNVESQMEKRGVQNHIPLDLLKVKDKENEQITLGTYLITIGHDDGIQCPISHLGYFDLSL